MDNYKIKALTEESEMPKVFSILKELRPKLSYPDFLFLYKKAHLSNGYELVFIENENEILALMGYRIIFDFVHGKHLYIDDLVTSEYQRSKGLGAKLLSYAEVVARQLNCKGLRLCTGVENKHGQRFYESNGWQARAIAYKKIVETTNKSAPVRGRDLGQFLGPETDKSGD